MNFNYNSNKIYEDWVISSKKIFSKWKDEDFFSDKATHVYFYDGVHDESVKQLQSILQQSAKTNKKNNVMKPPKPIVIHLNSGGGSVLSENLFNVMLSMQRVPLCVVVETMCASAATSLQLLAPYRVMIDFSEYLIHDSAGGSFGKEHEKFQSDFTFVYQTLSNYVSLVKDRTKLTDSEIRQFITRDMLVNSSFCLRKGIVDRVLRFPKINNSSKYSTTKFPDLSLKLSTFIKKTNLNHMHIDSNTIHNDMFVGTLETAMPLSTASTLSQVCSSLDKFMLETQNIVKKPLIVHFKPSVAFWLGTNCNPLNLVSLQYRLALIQKTTPVVALIEGPQALNTVATSLMCPIRIMMTPSIMSSYFSDTDSGSIGWGWKTIDVLYNTKYTFKEITRFLKRFSNLPKKFYTELPDKMINLKPKDSLDYGLIHQVIHFKKLPKLTLKDIYKYYDLNSLTSNYNNRKRRKNTKKVKITKKSKK